MSERMQDLPSPSRPLDAIENVDASDEGSDIAAERAQLLSDLIAAVSAAVNQLREVMAGTREHSDLNLKAAHELLKLAPAILGADAEQFEPPQTFEYGSVPLIPICEICGAGPGAHWTDDCPKGPPRRPRVL